MAIAVAACSSSSGDGSPTSSSSALTSALLGPDCDSVLVDCQDATGEVWLAQCVSHDENRNRLETTLQFDCVDGRTLYVKETAWGFAGDVVHRIARGDPAPQQARTECLALQPPPT